MIKHQSAIVVLSGGQDSTTCLAWAVASFNSVHAITFDYQQRHRREIEAAERVARIAGVLSHEIVALGPVLRGSSPLTAQGEQLETYSSYESMDAIIGDRVEKTFVPMRNALFLTLAANRAAVIGDGCAIVTGVCEADNANYPDCRGDFLEAQEKTINEALGFYDDERADARYISILAPLLTTSKADSIRMMQSLGSLAWLAFTHTAYSGEYPPSTQDHATVLRAQGFREAGVPDPLIVRAFDEGLLPSLPDEAHYMSDESRQLIGRLLGEIRFLKGQA